ncbi:ExeA family protein [Geomesophilobacter sediminis]|uniref:AAA family ATPase n=1 Tax=Geomesophilobacter sediminis TaxID=2798584 RepID=A0A8J7JLX2_9BACT|nr:AAA family ATPase [Geomesophilobacter sediminis]MBJ6725345.1 AAA family ATPase [Geomesophilobacter sediminis]
MYLRYYRLAREPFNITPDPEFLYLSPDHREALAAIVYGVAQRKGVIVIVGEVGVGKTTVLRSYAAGVNREINRVLNLLEARVSVDQLRRFIARELGLEAAADPLEAMRALNGYLLGESARGHHVVLVIDEAQNLPIETLAHLCVLSNLETERGKLLQVVLCGQPELETLLEKSELRQLRQRVAVKAVIRPLPGKERLAYIRHRLRVAAGNDSLFAPDALAYIADRAGGIPRVINILCDNSLVTSFGYGRQRVTLQTAREVLADFQATARRPKWRWLRTLAIGLGLGMVFFGSFFLAEHFLSPEGGTPAAARSVEVARSQAPPIPAAAEPPPAKVAAAQPEEREAGTALRGEGKTVRKGDTLAALVIKQYGFVNRNIIQRVKAKNPWIKDEDLIIEGRKVFFPRLEP